MKMKTAAAFIALCNVCFVCNAQNLTELKGVVMNAALDEPLEFASVALIRNDSIITGAMADENGVFNMSATKGRYVLQASFLGFKDVVMPLELKGASVDAGTLRLEEDANILNEVVIRETLPKTEIKGDAVITSIEGSILEHAGNSLDVLGKVPGMINRNGTLEVLGRGEPEYYINGRKVTDNSELRNLMSEDVKSIEVVSNPGALYGGDVRCVVRIRTVKRQGEGFSFALTSQAKKYTTCKDFDPSWTVLDLNYRKGGFDLFGKIVYWSNHGYQISDIRGGTRTLKDGQLLSQIQDGTLSYISEQGGIQHIIGANWQINDKHSMGLKIDKSTSGYMNQNLVIDNDFVVNGIVEDHVYSVNRTRTPESYQWNGNLYYDGNAGKMNINFNADFMIGRGHNETEINETSWTGPVSMKSIALADGNMYAAKLVLSYPVWKGLLQFGSEETYFTGLQKYSINKSDIPAADGENTENTIAGFAQYSLTLPFGQLSAGLRYEHVNFRYDDNINDDSDMSRQHDDWFPSVSFSTQLGEVGMSLSYTGKTLRPRLQYLTNEITYNNRYTYQSGDPRLRSEAQRTLTLSAAWKWLAFSSSYERVDNNITQWASPFNDNGVVMLRYANMSDICRNLNFYLTASPTFGVWNPRYTIGLDKPFLKLHVSDPSETAGERVINRDKPMFFVQTNNAFQFRHSWLVEVNFQYMSRMSQNIADITRPLNSLDLSVQKSFLKDDALTLRLSWNDILNGMIEYIDVDYGCYSFFQSNDHRNPGIVLRASYRFNSANSKYKGTGAGQSVKDRM